MKITHGTPRPDIGADINIGDGLSLELTGAEVATAIDAYLVAHNIHVSGPRTVTVNGELCEAGRVYVDPSGSVIYEGERWSGR